MGFEKCIDNSDGRRAQHAAPTITKPLGSLKIDVSWKFGSRMSTYEAKCGTCGSYSEFGIAVISIADLLQRIGDFCVR